jgi:para-nitrobenzyl esterase
MTLETTVRIEQGLLSGVTGEAGVRSYKGVPYARPPVGERRWRLPEPPLAWEGVRRAERFGANCPQHPLLPASFYYEEYPNHSEDCLYLNLWSPAEAEHEALPVMVWFHYGGFQFGGASSPLYDGAQLARAGVVVVTINHRLGRFGFLAHPELTAESEHHVSGNYGLHDQIAALEWVQRNVSAFGGDPDRVTIFGMSAGSMSVNLLMATPLARGLFHRAIGESGAILGPVGASSGVTDAMQDLASAQDTGLAIAEGLGARSLADLRARSVPELLNAEPAGADAGEQHWYYDAADWFSRRGALDGGFPIVDGRLLPRGPYDIFRDGEQAQVPLLTGSASDEGAGMPYMTDAGLFTADSRSQYGEQADDFLRLYPATDAETTRRASSGANGDRVFVWQNWTWARLHSRAAPTYYYHFAHRPPVSVKRPYAERIEGAYHSAEIMYAFRNLHIHDWPWAPFDRELSHVVSTYWVNFARSGDPNGSSVAPWPSFDPEAPQAMRFEEPIAMGPVPRREHLDFWDAYYEERR